MYLSHAEFVGFYFRVSNTTRGLKVRFHIINFVHIFA